MNSNVVDLILAKMGFHVCDFYLQTLTSTKTVEHKSLLPWKKTIRLVEKPIKRKETIAELMQRINDSIEEDHVINMETIWETSFSTGGDWTRSVTKKILGVRVFYQNLPNTSSRYDHLEPTINPTTMTDTPQPEA